MLGHPAGWGNDVESRRNRSRSRANTCSWKRTRTRTRTRPRSRRTKKRRLRTRSKWKEAPPPRLHDHQVPADQRFRQGIHDRIRSWAASATSWTTSWWSRTRATRRSRSVELHGHQMRRDRRRATELNRAKKPPTRATTRSPVGDWVNEGTITGHPAGRIADHPHLEPGGRLRRPVHDRKAAAPVVVLAVHDPGTVGHAGPDGLLRDHRDEYLGRNAARCSRPSPTRTARTSPAGPARHRCAPGESTTYTCEHVLSALGQYTNEASDRRQRRSGQEDLQQGGRERDPSEHTHTHAPPKQEVARQTGGQGRLRHLRVGGHPPRGVGLQAQPVQRQRARRSGSRK